MVCEAVSFRMLRFGIERSKGKPYQHARAVDVGGSARCLRYYGGWADKIQGDTIETSPKKLVYTIREPVGVCGQIIPYVHTFHRHLPAN